MSERYGHGYSVREVVAIIKKKVTGIDFPVVESGKGGRGDPPALVAKKREDPPV